MNSVFLIFWNPILHQNLRIPLIKKTGINQIPVFIIYMIDIITQQPLCLPSQIFHFQEVS